MATLNGNQARIAVDELVSVKLPVNITKIIIEGNATNPPEIRSDTSLVPWRNLEELEIRACDLRSAELLFATINENTDVTITGSIMPKVVDFSRASSVLLANNDFTNTVEFLSPNNVPTQFKGRYYTRIKETNQNWTLSPCGNGAKAVNKERLKERDTMASLYSSTCKCGGCCSNAAHLHDR